jgi:hypothetical protein
VPRKDCKGLSLITLVSFHPLVFDMPHKYVSDNKGFYDKVFVYTMILDYNWPL